MKVIILTEGGKSVGFGHIARCTALYQALEERGIAAEFILNSDDSILDLVKGKNYQIVNWLKDNNKLSKIIDAADKVIIDSYLADKPLYDKISGLLNNRLLVAIDDYNRIEYPGGIVINPSIYGDKLFYPKRDGITYLLGKDYVTLRKEFWDIPEKEINGEIKNILITFGGANYPDLVNRIIDCLESKFDFRFHVVDARKNKFTTKEMLNSMLKADICISGGGQTLYELARAGVPTLGICFADNQRLNLEGWQKEGFIEYIGRHNDKNSLKEIISALSRLLPYKERVKRSEIGRSYIDGRGATRVVDKIL